MSLHPDFPPDVPPPNGPEDYGAQPEWCRDDGGVRCRVGDERPPATVHNFNAERAKRTDLVDTLVAQARDSDGVAALDPEFLEKAAEIQRSNEGRFWVLRRRLRSEAKVPLGRWDKALKAATDDSAGAESPADLLVSFIDEAELFASPSGDIVYCDVETDGVRQTWPVDSRDFRRWLRTRYYAETGKAPYSEAVNTAVLMLDAKGAARGVQREVFVRVGGYGDAIYVDIGDDTWRAIEIDSVGWRIIDRPPVRFRRSDGMLPLPVPERGGDLSELRRLVNVSTDDAFSLFVAWLCAAYHPEAGMQYPVLIPHGEQGSAKSSVTRIARLLVDPSTTPLRHLPKDPRDLMISAKNGRALVFDNLSYLPSEMADALCCIVTGAGFATRKLHTDTNETLISAKRPVVLNGIEYLAVRPDLAERSIALQLEPIPADSRRPESEIDAAFAAAAPRILGALFERVANGLNRKATVNLRELPRMADFAVWAVACEPAHDAGRFLGAYARNSSATTTEVLASDPVAVALISLMSKSLRIESTMSELLADLGREAPRRGKGSEELAPVGQIPQRAVAAPCSGSAEKRRNPRKLSAQVRPR